MKKNSNQQLKVYEYIDEDGNVFWSFTESKERISIKKVRLVDRVGMWYHRWEHQLRRLVRQAEKSNSSLKEEAPIEETNWGKRRKNP